MRSSFILKNMVNMVFITLILGYSIFLMTGLPSVVVIRGPSMEPTLHEGDIVYIVPRNPEKIVVGDIIVFRVNNEFLVHRVVDRTQINEVNHFITKGDAHPYTDQDYGLPPVKPRAVGGVLFSLNERSLKIPRVGLIYVLGHDFILNWTSGKVFLLLPCIFLAATIIATYKKREKNRYPFSRSIVTKRLVTSIIVLTVIVMQLSSIPFINFRIHSFSLALGVETTSYETADFNLGSLRVGQAKNVTITLFALSAIKVPSEGLVYLKGNITEFLTLYNSSLQIKSDSANKFEMFAYANLNATEGVYKGKISVYTRPLWNAIPLHRLTSYFSDSFNVVIIDVLSNLAIAGGLVVFQLLFLLVSNYFADTIIWNYGKPDWVGNKISFYIEKFNAKRNLSRRLKKKMKWKKVRGMIKELTSESTYLPARIVPILLVLCVPSLFGYPFTSLVLSSIVSSLYMVFVNKQVWRPDMTLVSVVSSILVSFFYTIHNAMMNKQTSLFGTVWSGFAFFAPVPLLFLICMLVAAPGIYLSVYFALKWTARTPGRSLNILGDWDVVP